MIAGIGQINPIYMKLAGIQGLFHFNIRILINFLNKKNKIFLIKAEILVKEKKQGKIIFKVNTNLNKKRISMSIVLI